MAAHQSFPGQLRNVPEEMTFWARVYLTIAAARQLGLGFYCLTRPELFIAGSFRTIEGIMPFRAWGAVFVATGLVLTYGVWSRKEGWARGGLLMSVGTTALWAGGFLAAYTLDSGGGPSGWIAWGSLALKDIVMCASPIRTPFEPIKRRVLRALRR